MNNFLTFIDRLSYTLEYKSFWSAYGEPKTFRESWEAAKSMYRL